MSPLADPVSNTHYRAAMAEVHKQLQRPTLQRSMFSMARTTPRDLVRSKLSTAEISHRALSYLPDDMLTNIPEADNSYSLFQGFQATMPEIEEAAGSGNRRHRRRVSRGRKMLEDAEANGGDGANDLQRLGKERTALLHDLELLGIRKNMSSSEIRDIDGKIANLHRMRNIILDRLASFEQDEAMIEHEILEMDHRLEAAQALFDEEHSVSINTPTKTESDMTLHDDDDSGFMSQSIYEKISPSSISSTSSRGRKARSLRRKSMPILHEHFEPGTAIREIRVHSDAIIALDFDAPFGTMVTSSEDDTVRVWDLNAGRCIGALDRHTASIRALQIEDNILATGSRDATIRLWDLSRAHYDPHGFEDDEGLDDEAAIAFEGPDDRPIEPPPGTMADCEIFSLESHVDEVTALHFRGGVLVSGSADKTLRQWDLEKGRCVQTLDVMWAAAQAQANLGSDSWRGSGRAPAISDADFVGALQVFEAALACGTADGMVRLWDLRSGQVHRSLVGHTGPVTCLQFDDVHLVTASVDRSVRIWDLRTGSIFDAYAYHHPVTSMMFDQRRIVCAAGEDVVKVYDKSECRQWDCGVGATGEEGLGKRQGGKTSVVEKVRVRDGYLVEGRRDGLVGVWTC